MVVKYIRADIAEADRLKNIELTTKLEKAEAERDTLKARIEGVWNPIRTIPEDEAVLLRIELADGYKHFFVGSYSPDIVDGEPVDAWGEAGIGYLLQDFEAWSFIPQLLKDKP